MFYRLEFNNMLILHNISDYYCFPLIGRIIFNIQYNILHNMLARSVA